MLELEVAEGYRGRHSGLRRADERGKGQQIRFQALEVAPLVARGRQRTCGRRHSRLER